MSKIEPTGIVSVYATFESDKEARSIGRQLVEERLAACANILAPCHSIYRWQGGIQEAEEVPAIFKTRAETAGRLIARLTELHSYDVPAAVVWPIGEAGRAYAGWVAAEVDG
jgi:periplasmic divalent cation tolerance protein